MKKDFECHITMKARRELAERAVERVGFGWTFSAIDGDPVLGNEVFCYATNHFDDLSVAKRELRYAVRDLMTLGLSVRREKIEEVVHDKRYTHG